jgi:hypothetical protein
MRSDKLPNSAINFLLKNTKLILTKIIISVVLNALNILISNLLNVIYINRKLVDLLKINYQHLIARSLAESLIF